MTTPDSDSLQADNTPFVREECGDTMWDDVLTQSVDNCHVTYLGGPTVIFSISGLRLMTDPTLDQAGGTYPVTDELVVTKLTGPALSAIGAIDVVLLSHDQHDDNLDKKGRDLLKTVPLTLTTPIGAGRLGGTSQGLAPWESTVLAAPNGDHITITAVPARHGPAGVEQQAGDVTGFLLTVQGQQPFEVYITGDTVFYEGVQEVAKRFNPQYILAFAGAAQPLGSLNVTMSTNDLIDTAMAFPRATIIPLHYEGWSHYTQHREAIEEAFTTMGIRSRLRILMAGVTERLPAKE